MNSPAMTMWPRILIQAGLLAFCLFSHTTHAQTSDALVDVLVKKGILTLEEANALKTELAEEHIEKTAKDVQFYWDNGLAFQSGDGKTFEGAIGGRIQLDAALFSEDDDVRTNLGDQESGVEFRRVRLYTEGQIRTSVPVFYELQLDFAGAEVEFKDAYIGFAELPVVGSLRVGQFKEPFGMEILGSSKYITFMERSLPTTTFSPGRNTGIMIGRPALNKRMTWALGGFTESDDGGDGTLDSNARVTGRLTGLPYYDEEKEGRSLLHFGVAGSAFNPDGDMVQLRTRPEAHQADRFVDTGLFGADRGYLLGLETAWVCGPFSVQAEYMQTWLDATAGSNPDFYGYSVNGSWFLTGEHRVYKTTTGKFGRVVPRRSFGLDGSGWGAWEVTARYSHVDLDDAGITGGDMDSITTGVNWYFNANARLMFNYVFAQVDRSTWDGDFHAWMTRMQIDF